jgi:hypothetical protein
MGVSVVLGEGFNPAHPLIRKIVIQIMLRNVVGVSGVLFLGKVSGWLNSYDYRLKFGKLHE